MKKPQGKDDKKQQHKKRSNQPKQTPSLPTKEQNNKSL